MEVTTMEPNLLHIWNKDSQKYDIIDLNTGRLHAQEEFKPVAHTYSTMLADHICGMIREGRTLQDICRQPDMPSINRIYGWLNLHPDFKRRYQMARKDRADHFHDKALDIALHVNHKDDVPAAKLAVDTLKWAAEKANPENYGQKTEVKQTGGQTVTISLHTGVLDTPKPADIIVDEFGNFKGFADGTQVDMDTEGREGDSGGVVELSTDRWEIREDSEDGATDRSGSEDRETEEG